MTVKDLMKLINDLKIDKVVTDETEINVSVKQVGANDVSVFVSNPKSVTVRVDEGVLWIDGRFEK